jgi:serine/threonine protein kinase
MSDNMSYTLHFGADSQAAITLDDDATITMDLKDGSQRSIIAIPAHFAASYAEHFAHRTDLLRARDCLCQNTRRRNAPHQQPSLKRLSFPYIVEVYQYDETRNEYKVEFCDETLRKYIGTRNSNLAFATRKRIALQFLYGLNYIHSQGFLHRRRCGSGVRPR